MATACDPRVAELLRRRDARRQRETTDDPDEAAARGEPPGIVAALRARRQEIPTAEPPRVRKPAPAGKHCDRCGGRVNTFSQRCPRCDTKAPTTIDARPVRIATPEPEPEIAAAPEPEPAPTAAPAPTGTLCQRCKKRPVKAGLYGEKPFKTCPTCLADQSRRDAKRRGSSAVCRKSRCTRPAEPGKSKCAECLAKANAARDRKNGWGGHESPAPPLTAENCRAVKLAPPADPTSPAHYADLDPEPIDVIFAWGWGEAYCRGNVLKYVARAGNKGPAVEDYRKARRYLDYLIERAEA